MENSNITVQLCHAIKTLNWNKIKQRYAVYSTDWENTVRAKDIDQAVCRLAVSTQSVAWANEIKQLETQMKRESQAVLRRCAMMTQFKKLVLSADKYLAEKARQQDLEDTKRAVALDESISEVLVMSNDHKRCEKIIRIHRQVSETALTVKNKMKKCGELDQLYEKLSELQKAASLDEKIVSLQKAERTVEWVKSVRGFCGRFEAVEKSVQILCLNEQLLIQLMCEADTFEQKHHQSQFIDRVKHLMNTASSSRDEAWCDAVVTGLSEMEGYGARFSANFPQFYHDFSALAQLAKKSKEEFLDRKMIPYRQAIAKPMDFRKVFELNKTVEADRGLLCSNIPGFASKWEYALNKAASFGAEEAKKLYWQGNYSQAVELLIPVAEQGNGLAKLYLAKCYEHGRGVGRDEQKAIRLYTEAGDRKVREAYSPLGDLFYKAKRYREAVVCYQRAYESNDPYGTYRLKECYEKGTGVRQDPKKAEELLRKAAFAGLPEAMYDYAQKQEQLERAISYYGESDLSSAKAALEWYNKAAAAGHEHAGRRAETLKRELETREAAIRAAREEQERIQREQDEKQRQKEALDREIDLNYAFALDGDSEAQYMVGMYYFEGRGIEQNYYEAVVWFRKAAAQGNADAMEMLGDCYYNGYGVGQSYSEAMYWYNKAMLNA